MNNITVTDGDIFDHFENHDSGPCVMVHQANCLHCMNGGIALAIRKKWPIVAEVDRERPRGLGTFSIAMIPDLKDHRVANLYGQSRFYDSNCDRPEMGFTATNYNALHGALLSLCEYLETPTAIYIPYGMGCGLARGSWSIVSGIIRDVASASFRLIPKHMFHIIHKVPEHTKAPVPYNPIEEIPY